MNTNLVTDPEFRTFGTPQSLWHVEAQSEVRISAAVDEGRMRLTTCHTRAIPWLAEFRFAPFAVQKDSRLRLRCIADAKHEMPWSVWIGQWREPWSSVVSVRSRFDNAPLVAGRQAIDHIFEIDRDEPLTRLNFVLANLDNTVLLQCISLETIG